MMVCFFGALLYKGKRCKSLVFGLQFSSYVFSGSFVDLFFFFWSLAWDGCLNKEITSTDTEEQHLYSPVLSYCDMCFLPFSVMILEVIFFPD